MFDAGAVMRTTLAIDDDVLAAAKALAEQRKRSVGEIISELARQSLRQPATVNNRERNGIPLLAPKAGSRPVTFDLVNALRDEAP
jgi:hypothetical protein